MYIYIIHVQINIIKFIFLPLLTGTGNNSTFEIYFPFMLFSAFFFSFFSMILIVFLFFSFFLVTYTWFNITTCTSPLIYRGTLRIGKLYILISILYQTLINCNLNFIYLFKITCILMTYFMR